MTTVIVVASFVTAGLVWLCYEFATAEEMDGVDEEYDFREIPQIPAPHG